MKPCWRDHGLTEAGAEVADRVMPTMEALVRGAGPEVSGVTLMEAVFRVRDLPGRTAEFRERYLRENAPDRGEVRMEFPYRSWTKARQERVGQDGRLIEAIEGLMRSHLAEVGRPVPANLQDFVRELVVACEGEEPAETEMVSERPAEVYVQGEDPEDRRLIGVVRTWSHSESRQVERRDGDLFPVPGSYRRELVLEGFEPR